MQFTKNTGRIATRLRKHIQNATDTVSQGEAAAIAVWWSFIQDHAREMGYDPHALAKSQLAVFLAEAPIEMVREH